jgi:hypothetical protein
MPLLAYYIAPGEARVDVNGQGVGGKAIRVIADFGLQCVVSEFGDGKEAGEQSLRKAALEFHRVLQTGLRRSAIIPFSFPTVLDDEAGVAGHLGERSQEYSRALSRLRGLIQMEITFTLSETGVNLGGTGTEYLRSRKASFARLAEAAASVRSSTGELVREWRERDLRTGLRGFLLVRNSDLAELKNRMQGAPLPSGVDLRVSGPWPASEFLKEADGR